MNWYHRSKIDWLERCGLRNHEEWPLFGVKKHITKSGQVWVHLTALPPLDGHRDGLRRLLEEITRLERRLEREGIDGWIQWIERGNTRMRRWSEMIGARPYSEQDDRIYFCKVADADALPKTLKEVAMRYGGIAHGSA